MPRVKRKTTDQEIENFVNTFKNDTKLSQMKSELRNSLEDHYIGHGLKELIAEQKSILEKYERQENNNVILNSIKRINQKYKCEIVGSSLKINLKSFKVPYRHLYIKFKDPYVLLDISSDYHRDVFDFYTDHPHYCSEGGDWCLGDGWPIYETLFSVGRYDLMLEKVIIPVLTKINENSLLVEPEVWFDDEELEECEIKSRCPSCNRICNINASYYYKGKYHHKKCWERITENERNKTVC